MRLFFAILFAAVGLLTALWVVAGPAVAGWWNAKPAEAPLPPPQQVDTTLTAPDFSSVDPEQTATIAATKVVTVAPAAWRRDARLHALQAAPPSSLLENIEQDVEMYFSGDRDQRLAYFERTGAHEPALESGNAKAIEDMWRFWEVTTKGLRTAVIQPEDVRFRLRYKDGDGPFEAPEDELYDGEGIAPVRFPDMPSDPRRGRLTVVEVLVPYLFVHESSGNTESCFFGVWYARSPGDSPWRIIKTRHYSFTRPSQAYFPTP